MKTTVVKIGYKASHSMNSRQMPFAMSAIMTGILLTSSTIHPVQAETKPTSNQQVLSFAIPAGSISEALLRYSEITGNRVLFNADLVRGINSYGLTGNFSAQDALQKLLAGTGLSARITDSGSITLEKNSSLNDAATLPAVKVTGKSISDESPSLTTPSIADSKAKLNRVPGGTTVLDGERIKEGAALSVNDVLANAPGVYVGDYSTGSAGGSRISIRGSDANSFISPIAGIKILRNGMPFTHANGYSDTESFNFYALDHVDVYRGANALEYGGSNLGGAINLITPTGYTGNGVRIGMKYGTNDYVNPTISVGKVFDNGFDVYGSFSHLSTDTTRNNNKQEQFYGHGNVGYRWNEKQETRLYLDIQQHNFTGLDPLTKQQLQDNPRQNAPDWAMPNGFPVFRGDLKHSIQLGNGDHLDVGAYYGSKKYNYQWTGASPLDLWQDTGFNWRHEINGTLLGLKNRVIWGGLTQWTFINDWNYSTVNRQRGSLLNAERDKWLNVEGYLEDQLSLTDVFTLVAGLQLNYRKVDYERYEGYVASAARPNNQADKDFFIPNPKIGFTWQATKEAQLYGNLSRSAEPPPLFDLAHLSLNPSRDIQTSSTVEIGTRGQADRLTWDLAFYHAWVNNEYLITRDPADHFAFLASNADSTTLHTGIELGLQTSLPLNLATSGDELRLSSNYTWSNFRFDNDQALGNNQIPGIPEHNARLEAVYKHPSGFYIGPNAQIISSNWADFSNTLAAKPYALLGVRAGWDDGKHWKLFVDGRNLTDEHYASSIWVLGNANGADLAQFNPGATRSVFGGFEYRF